MPQNDAVFHEEQTYLDQVKQEVSQHIDYLNANPGFATGAFVEGLYGDVSRRNDPNANRQEHEDFLRIYANPYVGRMDFAVGGQDEGGLTAYIGEKSVYLHDQFYVYDWRTPVGQRFYMKNELQFHYNSYEYQLLLRRGLFVQNGLLEAYDTEYQNSSYKGAASAAKGEIMGTDLVTEPFLIRILNEKRRTQELTPIIISMQEEQNNINRLPIDQNIVVQGCAGSGKTMVLLHRMSYLKFNNPDLGWDRVKIITPNEMFNTHINALSNRLELSKIQRITVEKYYAELLCEYEEHTISLKVLPMAVKNKNKKLVRENVQKATDKILSERGLDKDFLSHIYSAEFTKNLETAYENNWKSFEKKVAYGLVDKINQPFGFNKNISFSGNTYKKIDVYLQTITAILSGEASAREMIVSRLERIEGFREKIRRDEGFVNQIAQKQQVLTQEVRKKAEEIVAHNLSIGESNTVRNHQKVNYLSPNIEWNLHILGIPHDEIVGSYRQIVSAGDDAAAGRARINDNLGNISALETEVETLREKIMDDSDFAVLQQSKEALSAFDVDLIFESSMSDALPQAYKDILEQIKDKERYRFYLYGKILFFYLLYGKIRLPDSLLAVDEGQDLSPGEYALMNQVNGGLHFNIYGDVNQLIKEGRGTDKWEKLSDVCQFQQFFLNINYRNTMEIAAYCNETLDMANAAVGITGNPVQHLALEDLPYEDFVACVGRTAIICKDLKAPFVKRITAGLKKNEHTVFGTIEQGKVSVIDIENAKGLEFDTVYVLPRDMGVNEQYIAYTRALSSLIIVA